MTSISPTGPAAPEDSKIRLPGKRRLPLFIPAATVLGLAASGALCTLASHQDAWKVFLLGFLLTVLMIERIALVRRRTEQVEKLVHLRTQELAEANEKLKNLGRIKNDFVAQVSHELRTPLAIIREGVDQVMEGLCGPPTPAQKETLSVALRNIDRLGALVEDLLDISKIETGRLPVRKQAFNLGDLMAEVFRSFQPRVLERGLTLRLNVPDRSVLVFADREEIIRLFNNLITNALKFTKTGTVELSMEQGNGAVCCSVSDTGPGIASEDMPKLFQKFRQIRRAENPEEKGTGLGLAICKGIIELHGGRIWAESEVGKGTRFLFTLPVASRGFTCAA